ncbi:hypothetical protein [Labedella populi]|nr:hypothetical protein [Labedella populi]
MTTLDGATGTDPGTAAAEPLGLVWAGGPETAREAYARPDGIEWS